MLNNGKWAHINDGKGKGKGKGAGFKSWSQAGSHDFTKAHIPRSYTLYHRQPNICERVINTPAIYICIN